jgi:hypothetical protein
MRSPTQAIRHQILPMSLNTNLIQVTLSHSLHAVITTDSFRPKQEPKIIKQNKSRELNQTQRRNSQVKKLYMMNHLQKSNKSKWLKSKHKNSLTRTINSPPKLELLSMLRKWTVPQRTERDLFHPRKKNLFILQLDFRQGSKIRKRIASKQLHQRES